MTSIDDLKARDDEWKARIVAARIEAILAEFDADIRSGDDWSAVILRVGGVERKL